MAHQPFARKYRPQLFEDLVGQPHVTGTLARALTTKRLGQAYLFAGQRGVGKTSAARILAKCFNCEHGPTAKPCNACATCTQITQGRSLDVLEIDGASNRGIDEIRSLRETVAFAPAGSAFRVYIIDEIHMLTTEAFNALLKTLEEPPAHVKFIFATTSPAKVPATILSRCQRFDFHRLEAATLVAALSRVAKAEKLKIEEPALYAVARAAEGSVRDAEVVLEQLASFAEGAITEADVTALLGSVESEALFALTQAILDRQPTEALNHLLQQLEQGKEPAQLLASVLHHVRNLLIVRSTEPGDAADAILKRLLDEPPERMQRLTEQAGRCAAQELLLILQILTGAYELIRRSPMSQTVLELVLLKLATREEWRSLEQISRRLEALGSESGPARADTTPAAAGATTASSASTAGPSRQDAPRHEPVRERPESVGASVGSQQLEEVAAVWPTFLEQLGAQKMSLAAYLAESKPIQLENGTLTVGLQGFSLHQEVLTGPEQRRLIHKLLSDLCRMPLTVQYATLPEPEPSARAAEKPTEASAGAPSIVQDIVKLFNATLIQRPPAT